MKHVKQYPGYSRAEGGNLVSDHGENQRALSDNICRVKTQIELFLMSKITDPKKCAELFDEIDLVIAQSLHVYARNFKMQDSTHTGTLVPQYQALQEDVALPIDATTLLQIRRGAKIHEHFEHGHTNFVPSFEGTVTVKDPQGKDPSVRYSDNRSMTSMIMGIAGAEQKEPLSFAIGSMQLDPENQMTQVLLVLKRLVQAFGKLEQGIRNRDRQAEKSVTTVQTIARMQADKLQNIPKGPME